MRPSPEAEVTESASPSDWGDATARTYAEQTRLAPRSARVEGMDLEGGGCRTPLRQITCS
jgi:hypothetical protein